MSFLVEDYVPERLELTLTPKVNALRPGQPAPIDLAARYLYGAPGSNLTVTGEVSVAASSSSGIKGLEGYVIGLDDEPVEASTTEVEQNATTDAQGRVSLQIPVQEMAAPRPTEARITLRVAEAGGRAVERSVTLPILPKGPVLAVRKTFSGQLGEGANASFDVVSVRSRQAGVLPAAMSPGACPRSSGAINGTIPTGAGATSRSSPRAAWPTAASLSHPTGPHAFQLRWSGAPTGSM